MKITEITTCTSRVNQNWPVAYIAFITGAIHDVFRFRPIIQGNYLRANQTTIAWKNPLKNYEPLFVVIVASRRLKYRGDLRGLVL